jgi:hypothetical protein
MVPGPEFAPVFVFRFCFSRGGEDEDGFAAKHRARKRRGGRDGKKMPPPPPLSEARPSP